MPRQKNVHPTNEVAHLWYHKTQPSARNGGRNNFYFEGPVIYSYGSHFPIARHVEHNGKPAILFTTRSYSTTTARHISEVRGAIPSSATVFPVANVPRYNIWDVREVAREYKTALDTTRKALSEAKNKPQRAIRYQELQKALDTANEFNTWAGLRERYKLPSNAADLEREAAEYETAKEERREVRRIKQYEENRQYWAKRDREAAERAERMPELLDAWRRGENPTALSSWELSSLPVMLRISGDEVETSKGARVPLAHAVACLAVVRRVMARGEEYHRNGHTIHIGHYAVDSISVHGTLTAGCHVIPWSEIERLAPQLEAVAGAELASGRELTPDA